MSTKKNSTLTKFEMELCLDKLDKDITKSNLCYDEKEFKKIAFEQK